MKGSHIKRIFSALFLYINGGWTGWYREGSHKPRKCGSIPQRRNDTKRENNISLFLFHKLLIFKIMETVYFGLGALTVMVVLLITVVVIGVVRLKNVLEELRQEREVRREVIGNLNRDIENVYRNISDEVSGLNRQIDSRYDQLRNLISKN
jgi:hypothetical protein